MQYRESSLHRLIKQCWSCNIDHRRCHEGFLESRPIVSLQSVLDIIRHLKCIRFPRTIFCGHLVKYHCVTLQAKELSFNSQRACSNAHLIPSHLCPYGFIIALRSGTLIQTTSAACNISSNLKENRTFGDHTGCPCGAPPSSGAISLGQKKHGYKLMDDKASSALLMLPGQVFRREIAAASPLGASCAQHSSIHAFSRFMLEQQSLSQSGNRRLCMFHMARLHCPPTPVPTAVKCA